MKRIFTFIILFVLISTSNSTADVKVTFFQQSGPPPTEIEIVSITGDFFASINFPEKQTIEIPNSAFLSPIEEFYLNFTYQTGETDVMDLVMSRPKNGHSKKRIYLYRPQHSDNYSDQTIKWQNSIDRSRGRKAFGPYFICRQNFYIADEKQDLSTKLRAGICWFSASVILTYADHPTTRNFFLPDLVAEEFINKVLGDLQNDDIDNEVNWSKVANSIGLSNSKVTEIRRKLKRIKYSRWRFYTRLNLVGDGTERKVCDLLIMYKQMFLGLNTNEQMLLIKEFRLTDQDVAMLTNSTALPASRGNCSLDT